MIKARLQEILIHPVLISLILWLVILFFVPDQFSRYRIKHIRDEYTSANNSYIFHDFDNDNRSEMLRVDLNDPGQTKILVSTENRVIDQFNLQYQPLDLHNIYSGDADGDGCSEFYIFTVTSDSIFLNIIDPLGSRSIIRKGRFIDFRRHGSQSTDAPQIVPAGIVKTGSGQNAFIFYITTGFSIQPRNVYSYWPDSDSLIRSPVSGAVISNLIISDIDDDPLAEFILSTRATDNIKTEFPYSDRFAWLMVLDHSLEFTFPPVKLAEYPSEIKVIPLRSGSKTRLMIFQEYFGTGETESSFYIYDSDGNRISEKTFSDFESNRFSLFENRHGPGTFYFLRNRNAEISELDTSLNVVRSISIPAIESEKPLVLLDADLDGREEYLFQGSGHRSLVIIREDFMFPVAFEYKEPGHPFISQKLTQGGKPEIYLQFNSYSSLINYSKNPLYYFKYPFYVLIYLGLFAFITLLAQIQKYRLSLKLETEKKIAGLQMKAIKNQIDPHFTLNILNAIGSLYATESDREKADYLFGKYARLVRQTVISSDRIIVTLAEEMEFVQNYIDLEKFRCDNSFDYRVEKDEDVDMEIKIPRTLIHTFVENAIKYGVRNRPEGGLIEISIRKADKHYILTIEDNGSGMDFSEKTALGTGKGLRIVNELIDLYYRLEKARITYSIGNNSISGEAPEGTKVLITLPA
ncbi:MAG: histidine kinase [Bacteroidales bacterium]